MRHFVSMLTIVTLAASAAWGGARLHLIDGQVLDGIGVELKEANYVLAQEGGDSLTIPSELVAKVELTGDDDPAVTGFVEAKAKTLVGPPGDVPLPNTSAQLQALGRPPAVFPRSVIDPHWEPKSDWNMDPTANNNWSPARWATAPIDWNWSPRSAFRQSGDVTEFSPVRWARSPVPYTWWPTDGFKARE